MSDNKEYIVKRVLHAGRAPIDFKDGTKIYFHFQTKLCDKENTIIDDSRTLGKKEPMQIVLGKKFKLEVWEAILQKMALGEVAQFTVDKSLVVEYPFVSKTLRDIAYPDKNKNKHSCAMTLQTEGIGYDDLNDLLKSPKDLEFIIEIVKVEQPGEYEKETWQMDTDERIDIVPKLKAEGNEQYNKKNYEEASKLYAKAIGLLEQLMLKEKPHDSDWNKLNEQKLPILLNFAQCKLNEEDYYPVITHCTEVLKYDNNVKAYFRRAKAHIAAWNPKEAKEDLEKVMELDKTLIPLAKKELLKLEDLQKIKNLEDKEKLKNLFT
ncbi:AH receptor-interacting protein isoform X2 [Sitophilus oryzae]|uniref:AH receptor-interacting protein isoform X2 n=1 Tax=Sitophilus oryzae TaxID=7048 RepID=A0A6J2XDJ1_SITOR|nr:AH receptor-interacting protein isoform X2 [Sitophilus oryzae]